MKKALCWGLTFALASFLFACGGVERKFEAAAEKFCASRSDGDRSSAIRVLVDYAKKAEFPPECVAEKGAAYCLKNDTVHFFRPKSFPVKIGKKFHFLSADSRTASVAFSHKNELALFDGSGDSMFSGILPGDADVMALEFTKSGQYILQGDRLLYRTDDGTVTRVLDVPVTGLSPSQATCRAFVQKSGDFLAINCGNAGVYSLSVVDVRQKKLLCKDVPNASFRFSSSGDSIAYITGASGSWSLIRMNIACRETKAVCRFSGLEDIAFAGEYICIYEKGKAQIGELKSEKFYNFPEGYDLRGAVGGDFLMKYNNTAYLLDAAVLYKGMQKLELCK